MENKRNKKIRQLIWSKERDRKITVFPGLHKVSSRPDESALMELIVIRVSAVSSYSYKSCLIVVQWTVRRHS